MSEPIDTPESVEAMAKDMRCRGIAYRSDVDVAQALDRYAALLRSAPGGEWQPAGTAPKDGQEIDILHRLHGVLREMGWHEGAWRRAGVSVSEGNFTRWRPSLPSQEPADAE